MERKRAIFEKNGLKIRQVEHLVHEGIVPGCSLGIIAGSGDPEAISFGYYSDRNSKKVEINTLYDLSSITKLFTTALILQLHQAGKLSIDEPCSTFLGNFRGSKIKIVDLLTHRVNFGINLLDYRNKYPNSFDEEIMYIVPPKEVSSEVYYANLGFIYLGKVIEHIENSELNTIMQSFIRKLCLKHTTTGVDLGSSGYEVPPTEIANGEFVQNVTHDESARLSGGLAGNAGIFASAPDLALFGRAWIEGKIVENRDIIRDLVYKNYDKSGKTPQALGWWLRVPGTRYTFTKDVYSHTGFTGSFLAINPSNSKVCAFTCNRTLYGRDNQRHREIWSLLTKWVTSR